MDRLSRPSRKDRQTKNNPSLGLGAWGPLVPANDCKKCLAALAGLQLGAGALLWLKPGRRPPPSRGIWLNRAIKIGGAAAGSYLIFMSGIEFARLALPYDPWVEDARNARKNMDKMQNDRRSIWNPSTWRYYWFGPESYNPVSWHEWQQRTTAYLEKVERARPHFEKMSEIHKTLATKNRSVANGILSKINAGEFPTPEIPVQELEVLNALPDLEDEQELYDDIDMSSADLWEFFEEPQAFSVIVIPRSTSAFLPGVSTPNENTLKSQNVNYMPIPQELKRGLR